jgi:hypothetical protein
MSSFKNILNQIVNSVSPSHQYQADAAVEFEKHYGDVFVGDIRNNDNFIELKSEYSDLSGKWDAFAHTYTSAIIASDYGAGMSHLLGDLRELRPNNSNSSSNQDYWNDKVGRDIADTYAQDQISRQIFTAIEAGITINNKNIDSRQYSGGSWWSNDYGLGLEASMIWTKAEWASGQINNFDYNNYGNSSNLTIPNFRLSNPIQDAINHLGNARNHASPLAIDLDNDGIETTNAYESNVFFDIKNSGFANRVGWIKGDDGILALYQTKNLYS